MEKLSRPVRNKKHSRRAWTPGEGHRPIKRLFTPEIKRMLKDWLVRRRENPYPSREEKKGLAIKTGLTYIQICNWFANWRRKLKNADKESQKNTWSHLIKNYNNNARGNVEQFSICSNDSIWEDEERRAEYFERKMMSAADVESFKKAIKKQNFSRMKAYVDDFDEQIAGYAHEVSVNTYKEESGYGTANDIESHQTQREQCFIISSTTKNTTVMANHSLDESVNKIPFNYFASAKYKSHIMEKYLRGLENPQINNNNNNSKKCDLSKWLESAANFTPDKKSYIEWDSRRMTTKNNEDQNSYSDVLHLHEKEELDAAEALTFLAGNCRNQMIK